MTKHLRALFSCCLRLEFRPFALLPTNCEDHVLLLTVDKYTKCIGSLMINVFDV